LPKDVRPDLNGIRIKAPHGDTFFLVEGGMRREIPTLTTFSNLFTSWDVEESERCFTIRVGKPLVVDAVLFKVNDGISNIAYSAVYLIDGGMKRPIASEATMDKYGFNRAAVQLYPKMVVDSIPVGDMIV